nr:uncharacterized protein LOC109119471 [Solanum lycopersicum]
MNASRIYQLHKAIATTVQDVDSIATYFSKLRNLWDEFASITPPPCNCPNSKDLSMHMEKQKLMQFLMGLNETYEQSRSQILMVEPTPTINKAYAMLIERESQRSLTSTSMSEESADLAALMAGRGGPPRYSKGVTSQSNSNQYYKGKKNWDLKCDYCKNQGHVEANYFRLHGYPPDWKFKKKGTGNNAYNANNVQTDNFSMHSGARNPPRAPSLTDEQHDHI